MKNFLKLLMLLMLALALVLAFVGCSENPEGTTTTADGSGSDGSEESTGASCEGLPEDGDHSFVMVSVSVEPSCTEKGEGLYRCSECGIDGVYDIAKRAVRIFAGGHYDKIFFSGIDHLDIVHGECVVKGNGSNGFHRAFFEELSYFDVSNQHDVFLSCC